MTFNPPNGPTSFHFPQSQKDQNPHLVTVSILLSIHDGPEKKKPPFFTIVTPNVFVLIELIIIVYQGALPAKLGPYNNKRVSTKSADSPFLAVAVQLDPAFHWWESH